MIGSQDLSIAQMLEQKLTHNYSMGSIVRERYNRNSALTRSVIMRLQCILCRVGRNLNSVNQSVHPHQFALTILSWLLKVVEHRVIARVVETASDIQIMQPRCQCMCAQCRRKQYATRLKL